MRLLTLEDLDEYGRLVLPEEPADVVELAPGWTFAPHPGPIIPPPPPPSPVAAEDAKLLQALDEALDSTPGPDPRT